MGFFREDLTPLLVSSLPRPYRRSMNDLLWNRVSSYSVPVERSGIYQESVTTDQIALFIAVRSLEIMPRMAEPNVIAESPIQQNRSHIDHASANPRQFVETWSWMTELLVFAFVALLLRLFVVWKTPLITKDGLIYVGIARTIDHGMWLQLVGDWFLFNPYPAMIAWLARRGVEFELAGQLINSVFGGLAIVPIYLWCRTAFDRRIAQLTALTYAFHPVVLRISGHVLREGLYWNLMCWGVYLFWLAARRGGLWRFALAGLFATAATLTRMEGAFVFLLGGMWTLAMFRNQQKSESAVSGNPSHPRRWLSLETLWPASQWSVSLGMFPLTIILLNVCLIPAGQGWQGGGRWLHFVVQLVAGRDLEVATKPPPVRMTHLLELERARQASNEQSVENVHDLAKSLPVWNSLGEPDLVQMRMQRFLILANDQQRFIFFGRFCNECIEGLLFPTVICCFWGLYFGRKTSWTPIRDWPLAIYSSLLICLLFYHLSREFILEPRYLFCLMPLVFPWSCIGAACMHQQLGEWFQRRPEWNRFRPSAAALVLLLMVCACGKLWLGLDDRSKVIQREIGTRLHQMLPYRLKIAGPESLRRVGHYADADYFIIPKGDPQQVENWLSQLPLDFVVLADKETRSISAKQLKTAENCLRYRELFTEENRRNKIQVFSVRPTIRQVGS